MAGRGSGKSQVAYLIIVWQALSLPHSTLHQTPAGSLQHTGGVKYIEDSPLIYRRVGIYGPRWGIIKIIAGVVLLYCVVSSTKAAWHFASGFLIHFTRITELGGCYHPWYLPWCSPTHDRSLSQSSSLRRLPKLTLTTAL